MTLKCLLVTNKTNTSLLTGFIAASGTLSLQAAMTTAPEAAAAMETSQPDIVFIDVEQYYKLITLELREERPKVFVCLVPDKYAAELPARPVLSIGLDRLNYEHFLHTVNKAVVHLLGANHAAGNHKEDNWFFIKSEYRMVKVNFSDILFCEGLKDYTQVYTNKKTKPIITLQNLKTFLDRLPASHFVRIHRSYIVSLNHIESISKKEVEIGEKVIPIGNSYRNNLLDIVKQYS